MLSYLAATLVSPSASPIATPSPTTAPGDSAPKWTDIKVADWTEGLTWATIVLGVATIALVVVTIWITKSDRTRDDNRRLADIENAVRELDEQRNYDSGQRKLDREAADARLKAQREHDDAQREQDRRDAAQRLTDERAESDRRLRDERKAAEDRATRQQQVEAAASLLQRIAEVDQFIPHIPDLDQQEPWGPRKAVYEQAREAVGNLKKGALAEALALRNPIGTRLYQALARLHMDALDGYWKRRLPDINYAPTERTAGDLRHFTRHVRLCLSLLIDTGDIPAAALGPNPDDLDVPNLTRSLEDPNPWMPATLMPCWAEDVQLDQYDPHRIIAYKS